QSRPVIRFCVWFLSIGTGVNRTACRLQPSTYLFYSAFLNSFREGNLIDHRAKSEVRLALTCVFCQSVHHWARERRGTAAGGRLAKLSRSCKIACFSPDSEAVNCEVTESSAVRGRPGKRS